MDENMIAVKHLVRLVGTREILQVIAGLIFLVWEKKL